MVPVIKSELEGLPRAEAAAAVDAVIAGDLDVFVVPDAGDTKEEALGLVAERLEAQGFVLPSPLELKPTKIFSHWHTDRLAVAGGPVTEAVNVHYTEEGEVLLQALVTTLGNPDRGYIKAETIRRIEEGGRIDPALFAPECLTAHIRPKGMAVFRSGGRQPVVHRFTSLVIPRKSWVWTARHLGGDGSAL